MKQWNLKAHNFIKYESHNVAGKKLDANEYVLYEMDPERLLLNTGYNYWGTISLKDSFRGGMMMCSYIVYNEYTILYRKLGDIDWMIWNRFSKLSGEVIYERIGFDLHGPLYMESSYVKLGNLITK